MRFHARYPLLQLWRSGAKSLVRAQTLQVARLEPAIENAVHAAGLLDLVFADADRIAVVPFVRVQPAFLVRRARTPLVWPSAVRELGFDVLGEIERKVLPWLESLTFARQQNAEAVRSFGDEQTRTLFERAREANFLGAAPYASVVRALAPYAYAARFCENRSVAIEDADGAAGAAMLAARAASVRADLGSGERNDLARRWFGAPIFGGADAEGDLVVAGAGSKLRAREVRIALDTAEDDGRIVAVASAVPSDVLISFDPEDAPVTRTFSVRANAAVPLRAVVNAPLPPASGGSSGTIVLLMREDFERSPDSDVDEARELAARLRAEGFSAELRSPSSIPPGYRADLVHAFGPIDAAISAALERFRASGVPIVANANAGPAPQEAAWGPAIVSAAHAHALDEATLAEYLDLVALRRLRSDAAALDPIGALAPVDVALVSAPGEEGQLRDAPAFGGEVVRYVPMRAAQPEPAADIASLVGTVPFVFVHAPVEWRANLPLLARAAAARGITLVVAGAAADIACLRYAAQLAPERFIHLPSATSAEVEALYRSARVYADLSFAPRGLGRLSRAASSGCRLLVSSASYALQVWPQAACADPASLESIEEALGRAWDAAPAAPASGPDLFSAAVYAYSNAAQAPGPN